MMIHHVSVGTNDIKRAPLKQRLPVAAAASPTRLLRRPMRRARNMADLSVLRRGLAWRLTEIRNESRWSETEVDKGVAMHVLKQAIRMRNPS